MATYRELLDELRNLIAEAAQNHQTDLELGRDVFVPLKGGLAQARLTNPELKELLEKAKPELDTTPATQGLLAEAGWSGTRDEGEQAIVLSKSA